MKLLLELATFTICLAGTIFTATHNQPITATIFAVITIFSLFLFLLTIHQTRRRILYAIRSIRIGDKVAIRNETPTLYTVVTISGTAMDTKLVLRYPNSTKLRTVLATDTVKW